MEQEAVEEMLKYYKEDLLSPNSFHQEVKLWQHMWSCQDSRPDSLSDTLADSRTCPTIFSNITKIINLLLLTSVTSCGVETANSSLKFIKNSLCSTIREDRFNALVLLFVHKNAELNTDKIIDMYARKHPRRMLLLNPVLE